MRLFCYKCISMEAPLWSCTLLVFLFYGCSALMDPDLLPANPVFATDREWVMHFSAYDPCSRWGFWLSNNDESKVRALNECAQAYDGFIRLTDREQESCLNAQAPYCRSGFGCNKLEYKCTFLCETEDVVWRRQDGGARRLERATRTVLIAKSLRAIAGTVVEPRLLPVGYEPDRYSRGQRRIYG